MEGTKYAALMNHWPKFESKMLCQVGFRQQKALVSVRERSLFCLINFIFFIKPTQNLYLCDWLWCLVLHQYMLLSVQSLLEFHSLCPFLQFTSFSSSVLSLKVKWLFQVYSKWTLIIKNVITEGKSSINLSL